MHVMRDGGGDGGAGDDDGADIQVQVGTYQEICRPWHLKGFHITTYVAVNFSRLIY